MRYTPLFRGLLLCSVALLPLASQAQTGKPAAKPAAVPAPVEPKPVPYPGGAQTGSVLDVSCNAEAKLTLDGAPQGTVKPGEVKKVMVAKPGPHFLKATSTGNPADQVNLDVTTAEKVNQTINLDLKREIDEREKAEALEKGWQDAAKMKKVEQDAIAAKNATAKTASVKQLTDEAVKLAKAFGKADPPLMVFVEGGPFSMGCAKDTGCNPDEKPGFNAYLSSYYIATTEVTQAQWMAVMGANPSNRECSDCPVEMVSYEDVQKFLTKLNTKTGLKYKLPTEAQWEYAAKGGAQSKGTRWSGADNFDEAGWFTKNSGDKTHPVAKKKANELGLYDMAGNVSEWCYDSYGLYTADDKNDPAGVGDGNYRVFKGGSYYTGPRSGRNSSRAYGSPANSFKFLGFRLCRLP